MYEQRNTWMTEQVNEWTIAWVNNQLDGKMKNNGMDKWKNEWMDKKWIKKGMKLRRDNKWFIIKKQIINEWMSE